MTTETEKKFLDLERHLDFYKSRCELLGSYQMKMRDPERTVVCDILANGCLLPDLTVERYGFAVNDLSLMCIEKTSKPFAECPTTYLNCQYYVTNDPTMCSCQSSDVEGAVASR